MPVMSWNLLADLPAALAGEATSILASTTATRIERIVSTGQASPPGFWYDQDRAEWVLLLTGGALVLIEGEAEPRRLGPGDALLIPAHCRHRVEWTDPEEPTVWLAVHFAEP